MTSTQKPITWWFHTACTCSSWSWGVFSVNCVCNNYMDLQHKWLQECTTVSQMKEWLALSSFWKFYHRIWGHGWEIRNQQPVKKLANYQMANPTKQLESVITRCPEQVTTEGQWVNLRYTKSLVTPGVWTFIFHAVYFSVTNKVSHFFLNLWVKVCMSNIEAIQLEVYWLQAETNKFYGEK